MTRHVILIGLSGAGKSTVGRDAARRLGCAFRDLDEEIVRTAGASVGDVFARRGEGAFRELERRAMEDALASTPHVIAAGGGWAAQPGNLDHASRIAFVIYLRCHPETAAERLGDAAERPLLVSDPLPALRAQLAERRLFYEGAHAILDTDDRSPDEVAADVAALARTSGGW